MEEYQVTLKIAAYLLGYPDEDWRQDFSEYRALVDEIKTPQVRDSFSDLFSYVENLGAKDLLRRNWRIHFYLTQF